MTATVEKVADGFRVDTGCLKYEVANTAAAFLKNSMTAEKYTKLQILKDRI